MPRPENTGAERPTGTKRSAHQGMLSLVGHFSLSVGKHGQSRDHGACIRSVHLAVHCVETKNGPVVSLVCCPQPRSAINAAAEEQ